MILVYIGQVYTAPACGFTDCDAYILYHTIFLAFGGQVCTQCMSVWMQIVMFNYNTIYIPGSWWLNIHLCMFVFPDCEV